MTEELAPTLERIRTYWNRLDKMVSSNPNQVTKDSPLILTMAQGVRLGLIKKIGITYYWIIYGEEKIQGD